MIKNVLRENTVKTLSDIFEKLAKIINKIGEERHKNFFRTTGKINNYFL